MNINFSDTHQVSCAAVECIGLMTALGLLTHHYSRTTNAEGIDGHREACRQLYDDIGEQRTAVERVAQGYGFDFADAITPLLELLDISHDAYKTGKPLDYPAIALIIDSATEAIERESESVREAYLYELQLDDQYEQAGVPVSHSA